MVLQALSLPTEMRHISGKSFFFAENAMMSAKNGASPRQVIRLRFCGVCCDRKNNGSEAAFNGFLEIRDDVAGFESAHRSETHQWEVVFDRKCDDVCENGASPRQVIRQWFCCLGCDRKGLMVQKQCLMNCHGTLR